MWNVFKSLVSTFIGKPIWGLLKKMFPQIDTFMSKFAGKTFAQIITTAGKAALTTVFGGWWDTFIGKMGTVVDFLLTPFVKLWAAIREGAEKAMAATLDDLVRRVWTNGLKSGLVTPLMARLTGIAGLIAAPFGSLWKAITGDVATAGDSLITRVWAAFKKIPGVKTIIGIGTHITDYMKVIGDWFMATPFVQVIKNLPTTLRAFWDDIPRLVGELPVIGLSLIHI